MGFDACITVYPKYKGEEMSLNDLHYIDIYLDYQERKRKEGAILSEVEIRNYVFDEMIRFHSEEKELPHIHEVPIEIIDYYKQFLHEHEYGGYHIYKDYAYWCSNGSGDIYEWFRALNKKNMEEYYLCIFLNPKDLFNFLSYCWTKLQETMPSPCVITHSFNYIKNEDEEENFDFDDEKEPDILLRKCDGIEVTFLDENDQPEYIKRINTASDYDYLGICKNYFDTWDMSGYLVGFEGLLNLLKTEDLNGIQILYHGGW